MKLYHVLHAIRFDAMQRAIFRMEVRGAEHVPASGPAILVANHESVWDPFILGVLTRRNIRYMAKAELWRYPVVKQAMNAFGTFPVERGNGDLLAMRAGVELLRQGEVLGVFPQGTSKRNRPRRFHRGAARLALQTGAPIVPVRLIGTRGIFKRGFPKVTIEALPPIHVEQGKATVAVAKEITSRIEEAVT